MQWQSINLKIRSYDIVTDIISRILQKSKVINKYLANMLPEDNFSNAGIKINSIGFIVIII